MPPVTQIVDPLWHCLCPSFYAFSKRFCKLPRLTVVNAPRPVAIAQSPSNRSILYHTSVRQPEKKTCSPLRRLEIRRLYTAQEASLDNPEDEEVLKQIPKEAVWAELRKASSKSDFIRVQRIVRILVGVHAEPPNPSLYTALILANASPQHGSVNEVEDILRDMAEEGVSPDSAAYHAVLKVRSAAIISLESSLPTVSRSLLYIRTTSCATRSLTIFAQSGFLLLAMDGMT